MDKGSTQLLTSTTRLDIILTAQEQKLYYQFDFLMFVFDLSAYDIGMICYQIQLNNTVQKGEVQQNKGKVGWIKELSNVRKSMYVQGVSYT